MSQIRLDKFLRMVQAAAQAAHQDFTESRSCLNHLLGLMRQQVATKTFNLVALQPKIASARKDKRGAKYEDALRYVEKTWGKASLEYKGPNQAGFVEVTGQLYVLKGTQVTFREVDSQAQGTYTFSVNSTANDAMGAITASVKIGTNTHSVKAIVYELKPLVTFEDTFRGHSDADLGVNEPVTLGFTTVPAGVTAAQAGGLLWMIHPAVASRTDARQLKGIVQRTSGDASEPLNNGTAYFIAPWATDSARPLNPTPARLSSVATLRLVIQDGPSKDSYVEKSFTVHTFVARMVARAPFYHVQGRPSAGFTGDVYLDPKDVSFHYIKFKEGRGTFVAKQTGFKSAPVMDLRTPRSRELPPSPSGYFACFADEVHPHTTIWVDIGTGDITNGCKLTRSDTVKSGGNDRWPNKYDATHASLNGKATDEPSEAIWPIYWKYKAADLSQEVLAQQVKHKATMDKAGTVTMEKAGASKTFLVSDSNKP